MPKARRKWEITISKKVLKLWVEKDFQESWNVQVARGLITSVVEVDFVGGAADEGVRSLDETVRMAIARRHQTW